MTKAPHTPDPFDRNIQSWDTELQGPPREVECITDVRVYGGHKEYYIKYAGSPASDSEWVRASDREAARDKILDFESSVPKTNAVTKRKRGANTTQAKANKKVKK